MTDLLDELLGMVQAAQAQFQEPGEWSEALGTLRLAEGVARAVPTSMVLDVRTFAAVAAVRTELDACLLAAEQLGDAGVAAELLASVLGKAVGVTEQRLEAVIGAATVDA